jgi:hypothetical protein
MALILCKESLIPGVGEIGKDGDMKGDRRL